MRSSASSTQCWSSASTAGARAVLSATGAALAGGASLASVLWLVFASLAAAASGAGACGHHHHTAAPSSTPSVRISQKGRNEARASRGGTKRVEIVSMPAARPASACTPSRWRRAVSRIRRRRWAESGRCAKRRIVPSPSCAESCCWLALSPIASSVSRGNWVWRRLKNAPGAESSRAQSISARSAPLTISRSAKRSIVGAATKRSPSLIAPASASSSESSSVSATTTGPATGGARGRAGAAGAGEDSIGRRDTGRFSMGLYQRGRDDSPLN